MIKEASALAFSIALLAPSLTSAQLLVGVQDQNAQSVESLALPVLDLESAGFRGGGFHGGGGFHSGGGFGGGGFNRPQRPQEPPRNPSWPNRPNWPSNPNRPDNPGWNRPTQPQRPQEPPRNPGWPNRPNWPSHPSNRPSRGGTIGRLPQRPRPMNPDNHIPDFNPSRSYEPPRVGPNGNPVAQRPFQNSGGRIMPLRGDNLRALTNRGYLDRIKDTDRNWDSHDGGYHWRDFGRYRACHHYDPYYGIHWWGWYVGGFYFWSPYYAGYWWWFDPYWHRWVFLYNDSWWYQDGDVVYVYNDGSYYLYDDAVGGAVAIPDSTPPVEQPPQDGPAQNQNDKIYYSADGTRTVEVDLNGRAYLYDTASPPAFSPVWLGDGVTEVRFENDEDGNLLQILVLTSDGSFRVYDADGNPMSGQQGESADPGSYYGSSASARPQDFSSSRGVSLKGSAAFKGLGALGSGAAW